MQRLGFLAILLSSVTCAWADLPKARNAPRIEVAGERSRRTKVEGGDWDDRTQKVQFEAVVKNLELNRPAEGLKLYWWALAESLVDRKKYLVIDNGTADVNLTSDPAGREMRVEGKEVTLQWDDTNIVHGQRYKGYVVMVTNEAGELVAAKTSFQSWDRNLERALDMKTGNWVDRELKPTNRPRK